ncbi:MAG: AraC family transcriptional regulator [Clostridiales Family XIII bacterium]|jgi:AraC-like DNA-binding protein|nr:AraC family transcriptional regulator [Clostridiales Family XIII bacterium]
MKKHQLRYSAGPIRYSIQEVIDYPFYWRDCIEIIYVLSGSLTLELIKDPSLARPLFLQTDDIYISTMNELHRIYRSGRDNRVLLMQIDGDFVRSRFGEDIFEFPYPLTPQNAIESAQLEDIRRQVLALADLVRESESVGDRKREQVEQAASEMLGLMTGNFTIISRALSKFGESKVYLERYTRIASYVTKHFMSKNVLQEVAERERLSAEYVSHEVKRHFGLSLLKAVTFYRVAHSVKLLLETDLTLDQIAYESGFSAPKYFYRNFRKYRPEGPLAFRKKYKELYANIEYVKCFEEADYPSGAAETFATVAVTGTLRSKMGGGAGDIAPDEALIKKSIESALGELGLTEIEINIV